MPLKKGDKKTKEISAKGVKARAEMKEQRLKYIAGGGLRKSVELLHELLEGRGIKDEQKEGMEFLLKFLPYAKPKFSSVDQTVTVEDKRVILD